jgi:hypothetical protein
MVSGATSFDQMARALGLSPAEYADSTALKEWVRANKDEKYVPSELLKAWGFDEEEAA